MRLPFAAKRPAITLIYHIPKELDLKCKPISVKFLEITNEIVRLELHRCKA